MSEKFIPKKARIVVNTDEQIKTDANETFEKMGLNLSQGIVLYLREIIATGKLPFEIQTPAARIKAENAEALAEVRAGKRKAYSREDYMKHFDDQMREAKREDV